MDLIVKQQSLTGFELKLTPMGLALVPTENNIVGTRHCRLLISATNNSDATGFDITNSPHLLLSPSRREALPELV